MAGFRRALQSAACRGWLVWACGMLTAACGGASGGSSSPAPTPLSSVDFTLASGAGSAVSATPWAVPGGGEAEAITFVGQDGHPAGLGIATFPRGSATSAAAWLTATWDPSGKLLLAPCKSALGDCELITDSTAFRATLPESAADFPALAVVLHGERVIVISRDNGVLATTDEILAAAGITR